MLCVDTKSRDVALRGVVQRREVEECSVASWIGVPWSAVEKCSGLDRPGAKSRNGVLWREVEYCLVLAWDEVENRIALRCRELKSRSGVLCCEVARSRAVT